MIRIWKHFDNNKDFIIYDVVFDGMGKHVLIWGSIKFQIIDWSAVDKL